jgi:Major Facilitator Superfamily
VRQPGGPSYEIRTLWVTELVSTTGDQLAKVAVAIAVYQRTQSAAASALTYALTLVPNIVAGPLLAPLADRYPRRELMVVCAATQGALVLAMAAMLLVPSDTGAVLGMSFAVLGVSTATAPFRAARDALLPDVLGAARAGQGKRSIEAVREVAQLLGLAGAAGVVVLIGPGLALLADAVSFGVAAVLIGVRLRRRHAANSVDRRERGGPGVRREAVRSLVTDQPQAVLLVMAALVAPTIVPDAVVVPLVQQMGAPTEWVGVLLAADCVGFVVAHLVQRGLQRRWPALERVAIGPLLVLSLAPLVGFLLRPGPACAVILLIASGAGATYLPLAAGELSARLPSRIRGAGMGMARTVVTTSQGVGALVAGAFADRIGSATMVVGWPALASLLPASLLAVAWARTRGAVPVVQG